MKKLITNKIKCKKCGDIIESTYTHDYKQCSCGECAVDGGLTYARRNFKGHTPEESYEELSIWKEEQNNA
ncbi:MAG: hypothetical protein ACI4PE_02750 [Bacilli bacterium]